MFGACQNSRMGTLLFLLEYGLNPIPDTLMITYHIRNTILISV